MKKIDIFNLSKYLRRTGDNKLARIGHVNVVIDELENKIDSPVNPNNGDGLIYDSTSESWISSVISGGGLEGTQYVFVQADGTPEENATELQEAYDTAKTMSPSADNRITVIAAPGHYKLSQTLVMDNDFIDLVSLTGEPDVVLDLTDDNFYTGEVDLTALGGPTLNVVNDPFVVIDLAAFDFNSNPALSLEADCKIVGIKTAKHESNTFEVLFGIQTSGSSVEPYFLAIGNEYYLPINQIDAVSPTVKNVEGGFGSFGLDITQSLTTTINGYFENVSLGVGSLQGVSVNATMVNCRGYLSLVESEYSGQFINVVLDGAGFGGYDLTGQFIGCIVTDSLLTGDVRGFDPNGDDGDIYGYFENCKVQGFGFAPYGDTKIKSTAYLKNCEVYSDDNSFGHDGIEEGAILENCVGGNGSFCQNGGGQFGTGMQGKLIRCRKTSGTFPSTEVYDPIFSQLVQGNGKIILCIDGNNTVITY